MVAEQESMRVAVDPTGSYGNVPRVISFVFETTVGDFGSLSRSEEYLELRFFGPGEFATPDVMETARPLERVIPETRIRHGRVDGGK